ncbi:MAG: N-methyl-L-tryptophan oxidase [Dehalococcoidia bacterium]
MAEPFDVVVIGAGAVGSAAAYHLARSGRRGLLLEQFQVGHDRGSSHGQSRIIRHSYYSADYASLAPEAFAMWRELERESGANLLTMTGGIDMGLASSPELAACKTSLDEAGFGSVWLEGEEAQEYAPQFVLPDDCAVLWQSGAGILNADRCVRALAAQAIAHGARLAEGARVTSIEPGPRRTEVAFERAGSAEKVEARSVVVAAGPWGPRLFGSLGIEVGLRVTHQQVVYYPVEDPSLWSVGRCPIYIAHGRRGFYGFPICERPGFIKVATEMTDEIDPDTPPGTVDTEALAGLNERVATMFRGIRPEPAEVVTCRYTESPDKDFIIDQHPEHSNIVLASPCSGHGFKFSVLTGKLAGELATAPAGDYQLPLWRERFRLKSPVAKDGPC